MPTSTPSIEGKILHRSRCAGDLCALERAWPIHNVRHRGVFLRLCTSCVLKYNPGSFCTICFDFFKESRPPPSVVHCSSCPSLTHISCLSSDASDELAQRNHLCPTCANPSNFSYFPFLPSLPSLQDNHGDDNDNGTRRKKTKKVIDRDPSKVLLLASRIASGSMFKALGGFRAEAQRKAKEAVAANRRATEMLERSFLLSNMDKGKKMNGTIKPEIEVQHVEDLETSHAKKKLKAIKSSAAGQQKRVQSRERDTLMKFQEPVSLAMVAAAAAAATSDSAPDATNYNNSSNARGGGSSLKQAREDQEKEKKDSSGCSNASQCQTLLPSPNQDPS